MKGQVVIIKLENQLNRKSVLLQDLYKTCRDSLKHSPQISIHVLQARKIPLASHPKTQRIIQITLDSKDYRTDSCITEGYQQISKWSESFLLPLESISGTFKLALIEKLKDKENVVGGVMFYLSTFEDQKRHDGWYDVGYGEIRLAIRMVYNANLLYQKLIEQLQDSINFTEKLIKNCSTGNLNANIQLEILKTMEFSFISNAHDLLINIFRFGIRYLLLKNRVKNSAAKKITAFIRSVVDQKHNEMIYTSIQGVYDSYDEKVKKEVKICLEFIILKTVENYKETKTHTESTIQVKKLIATPKKIEPVTNSELSLSESRRKVPIQKRVNDLKKINEPTYASMGELKLKIDSSSRELIKNKEADISQSYKVLKMDSSTLGEAKDKLPAQKRKFIAKRY